MFGKTFKLSIILSVAKHVVCFESHASVLDPWSYRPHRHCGAKSALIYPLKPKKPQPILWKAVSGPSLISSSVGLLTPAYAAPCVCGGTAKRSLHTVTESTWSHPVLCPEDSSDVLHICSVVSVHLMQRQIRLSKFIFVVTLKLIKPSSLCEQIRDRWHRPQIRGFLWDLKKNKKTNNLLLKISTQKPVQSAVSVTGRWNRGAGRFYEAQKREIFWGEWWESSWNTQHINDV